MKQRFVGLLWKYLPKKKMSRIVGNFSRKPISKKLIPHYVRYFKIDLQPVKQDLHEFNSLLDFFVRELEPDARPIHPDPNTIISPVDGTVSQFGTMEDGAILQAKGVSYSLLELLGNDEEKAKRYVGGTFVTIYLSPRDYHRIHMPVQGKVTECDYLPGNLYPVNKWGVRHVPALFARNERVISYIDSPRGSLALIKVGATNVGSIKVTYEPELSTNTKNPARNQKKYQECPALEKGEEIGRFEFGSTVILLFEKDTMEWTIPMDVGTYMQMGQPIAQWNT
ncbi:archaetidylserine decarboxylase [Risungbinella massiliensis]|uniref:archaetidylserine decarboxylase n=1 Tax=Risungbinella massiliensis TaxID=1329796 RepID=UPI0005CC16B4|nr:archaetidylserine decarboxylase [Risungbinella massiliensis]